MRCETCPTIVFGPCPDCTPALYTNLMWKLAHQTNPIDKTCTKFCFRCGYYIIQGSKHTCDPVRDDIRREINDLKLRNFPHGPDHVVVGAELYDRMSAIKVRYPYARSPEEIEAVLRKRSRIFSYMRVIACPHDDPACADCVFKMAEAQRPKIALVPGFFFMNRFVSFANGVTRDMIESFDRYLTDVKASGREVHFKIAYMLPIAGVHFSVP